MKKTYLVLTLFFLVISSVFAQTEKGTWMLGGSAGWSRSSSDYGDGTSKTSSLTFNPDVSYFIVDNVALGLLLPLSFSRNKFAGDSDYDAEYRNTGYGLGPNIRAYFPLNEKWALLAQAGYTFGWQKTKMIYEVAGNEEETENNDTWKAVNVGGGITYFINKSIGVEGILGYQGYKYGDSDYSKNDNVSFTVGLQIYFAK
jgi:hypothetical protein